ncbi:PHD finger-containing protein 1-like isoform X2 [Cicer arietinum]|uniref:Uncharacterized protein LOC101501681 isoform X2 n=1 Tax=Cicer arietinum TaxID=3827 RepID=A0A1S2XZS1_CICAR|nr:uncharacterized protein LOC101501681 isoform X2 [Cicer arietinum]
MDIVCLKCGDVGFKEAIVFCSKCQSYALHRYCLDGPVIFIDDVIWFCEDCEPKPIALYSLDQSTLLSSKTTNSANLANNAIQSRRKLKYCIKRPKKSNQRHKKKIGEKQKKEKVNSGLVAKTKVLLSDSSCLPELEHPQCSISHRQENESKNECGPVPTDATNSNVDAQPIAEPIWRGNLFFCNEAIVTVNGLQAHLSSLASLKVLTEARLFPEVLCADLLPRSVVWPNSFKNEGPTNQNIALYFFGSEKIFDKLVDDIIRKEVAIRVGTKNAVLLIFPSTLLPIQHQKFQTKYYLWGVFRKKSNFT